jgi:hypothetical protein
MIMKKLFKILVITAGPEICYRIIGPSLTIRSTLSREEAARLLAQGHLDLILGPRHLLAVEATREFPEDRAA